MKRRKKKVQPVLVSAIPSKIVIYRQYQVLRQTGSIYVQFQSRVLPEDIGRCIWCSRGTERPTSTGLMRCRHLWQLAKIVSAHGCWARLELVTNPMPPTPFEAFKRFEERVMVHHASPGTVFVVMEGGGLLRMTNSDAMRYLHIGEPVQ